MKVCVIQPAYSIHYADSDRCFEAQLALLDQCDPSMDIIVLPESGDIPALSGSRTEMEASVEKYNARLLTAAADTARRCHAMVFVNCRSHWEGGLRNTTHAFDREGSLRGQFHKTHLTPGEQKYLDTSYTLDFNEPYILEMEGIRFGFLTCYDFYFYEMFPAIARKNVDIIIGCSHQRSDTHEAIEILTRFLAYNTNAYVLRASVSMDESSDIGGGSMIVAPNGDILANLYSQVGLASAEIDPKAKYFKPAGFGNPPSAHYEYTEKGRRPWNYRPAGPAIVPPDSLMPYPRICAHRGFCTVAPENSLPAYGAAVALGAQEIEFDLWFTKDEEIVSMHDETLDRVSTGTGKVSDYTYEELLQFDFGIKFSPEFAGLPILRFEDILKKLGCQTIMNVHIKAPDYTQGYDPDRLRKIIDLIDKYDCRKHVYFMCGNDHVLRQLGELAPDICRCCGGGIAPWQIVDRAIELGCRKVQLFKPYFDQSMIDKAHAHGILCNVFYADEEEEACRYIDMGIDTILTNEYNRISQAVRKHIK